MVTMKDNFLSDKTTDAEFDGWLATQLKSSRVSAPEDIASKVITKLDTPPLKGHIDPLMLIILFGILTINVALLAFPYIIPAEWIQKVSGLFVFETYARLSSIKDIINAIVVVGMLFVGIDFLLSKKFGGKNITIA